MGFVWGRMQGMNAIQPTADTVHIEVDYLRSQVERELPYLRDRLDKVSQVATTAMISNQLLQDQVRDLRKTLDRFLVSQFQQGPHPQRPKPRPDSDSPGALL